MFAADLTVFQLRQALKRRHVSLGRRIKTKAQLVARYQQLLQDKRDARVFPTYYKDQNQKTRSDLMTLLPADLVVEVTQALVLGAVSALARTCRSLNGVVSLNLKGQPSLALWRRRYFDATTVISVRNQHEMVRAMFRMAHLETVCLYLDSDLFYNTVLQRRLVQALVHTSGRSTLRRIELQNLNDSDSSLRLQSLLQGCQQLQRLELENFSPNDAMVWLDTAHLPLLQVLKVTNYIDSDSLLRVLTACPNLLRLSLDTRFTIPLSAKHAAKCPRLQTLEYGGSAFEMETLANGLLHVLSQCGADGAYPMPALRTLVVRNASDAAIANFNRTRPLQVQVKI